MFGVRASLAATPRTLLQAWATGAPAASNALAPAGARGMATLKDLKLRINSTTNIRKITKSMKMIASTKLVRAQREMGRARSYGALVDQFDEVTGVKPAESGKNLVVAISSDKGLCGGVHSAITRNIRGHFLTSSNVEIVSVGDKCKAQLSRLMPDKMTLSFSSVGQRPPTFLEAGLIADQLLRLGQYDTITIVFNKFKSAIAYEPTHHYAHSLETLAAAPNLDAYETEDDVLQNLQEFNLANQVYRSMADGYAAETSARMSAMDNATKNAGEIIGKLTIVYNRTRQAAITTELVDIITGASAL